jgi:hypothetical protein
MAKLTKNRKESLTKFDAEKMYSLKEASDVIKSFSELCRYQMVQEKM